MAEGGSIISNTIEDFFKSTSTGSMAQAILNNLTGFNHVQTPNAVPSNVDMPGFTFFTRPQLNLQRPNIRNVRQLSSLLNDNPLSIQKYIRNMLDPRLYSGVDFVKGPPLPPDPCYAIDNQCAFIVPFTNNFLSCSGWPSISVPTFKSNPGLYNEVYTMVDGRVINNDSFDITVNFRNTRGDPILYMLYVWAIYMSMVFEGKMVPYYDYIVDNMLDYQTRIYRIVTDYTKQKISKMSCCNVAIPVGVPVGDAFDVPGDRTYNEANQTISMQFSCNGVRYFDDLIAYDFNRVVEIFNPSMKDEERGSSMIRIPVEIRQFFNFKGYPYINIEQGTLEWYVFEAEYYEVAERVRSFMSDGTKS